MIAFPLQDFPWSAFEQSVYLRLQSYSFVDRVVKDSIHEGSPAVGRRVALLHEG